MGRRGKSEDGLIFLSRRAGTFALQFQNDLSAGDPPDSLQHPPRRKGCIPCPFLRSFIRCPCRAADGFASGFLLPNQGGPGVNSRRRLVSSHSSSFQILPSPPKTGGRHDLCRTPHRPSDRAAHRAPPLLSGDAHPARTLSGGINQAGPAIAGPPITRNHTPVRLRLVCAARLCHALDLATPGWSAVCVRIGQGSVRAELHRRLALSIRLHL
jgi:hypothetical protein